MKNLRNLFLFFLSFCTLYYGLYTLLFSITINGRPLIKSVQKELILDKDIFGKAYAEFDRSQKYDLLFLGSSHCYRDFDPKIFEGAGYSCYNLGSSSQAPVNSYAVLKQTIRNVQHVMLEVYPVAGNLSGTEAYYAMACSGIPCSVLAPMAVQLNNLRCYNILSIKPLIDRYNSGKPFTIQEHYKGYVATSDSAKGNITYEEIHLKQETMDIQLEYVKKIAELCEDEKVKLSFVYAPVPRELKLVNEEYYVKGIEEIAAAHKLAFFNSGRQHRLNSRDHFYDDDHLNSNGVGVFNLELLSKMGNRIRQ